MTELEFFETIWPHLEFLVKDFGFIRDEPARRAHGLVFSVSYSAGDFRLEFVYDVREEYMEVCVHDPVRCRHPLGEELVQLLSARHRNVASYLSTARSGNLTSQVEAYAKLLLGEASDWLNQKHID